MLVQREALVTVSTALAKIVVAAFAVSVVVVIVFMPLVVMTVALEIAVIEHPLSL